MCLLSHGETEGGVLEGVFEEFAAQVSDAVVFRGGCVGGVQGDEFGFCVEG